MVGLPKPISVNFEGIGDEPTDSMGAYTGSVKVASYGVRDRDEHVSFPKGLPKAFVLKEEHLKD